MGPEEPVTRIECMEKEREHKEAFVRVHDRVDKVEKSTASIETSAKIMSDCVCKMEKVMFGDQNADGIITKVSNLKQKVDGVYWVAGVTIAAIIVVLVGVAMKR